LTGYFLFPFNTDKSIGNETLDQTIGSEVVVSTEDVESNNTNDNTMTTEEGTVVSGNESGANNQALDSQDVQTIEAKKNSEQSATLAAGQKKSTQSASENVSVTPAQKGQSTNTESSENPQTESALPRDTLEEKAKRVIRGNYGNGINRKNALGSEFRVIQNRVNELYKTGDF
jgi:hypothetical protein